MRLAWRIALLVAFAGHAAIFAAPPGWRPAPPRVALPDMVELRPGAFDYRASGEFTRDGRPAPAPRETITIARPLTIMRHQVTAADYRLCVDDGRSEERRVGKGGRGRETAYT